MTTRKLFILDLLVFMILLPTLSLVIYSNDYELASYSRVVVYCIEDYNGKASDLERVCVAADTFKNTLDSNAFVYILRNDDSKPKYWWTEYVGGTPYQYEHAYQWHYIIFLGHGSPTTVYFGVDSYHQVLEEVNRVDLASYWYINNVRRSEVYFHRVWYLSAPKWVTFASCRTLELTNTGLDGIIRNSFEGRGDLSKVYLHGMVGMRTNFLVVVKNGLGQIVYDAAVETMKDYASRLRNGESIVDAWFNAVWTKQQYHSTVDFEGHPAAVTLIIRAYDAYGNQVAEVDYRTEKMYTIGTIYDDPRTVVQSFLNNGWSVTIIWIYIVG